MFVKTAFVAVVVNCVTVIQLVRLALRWSV